jgi:hypothetical protein
MQWCVHSSAKSLLYHARNRNTECESLRCIVRISQQLEIKRSTVKESYVITVIPQVKYGHEGGCWHVEVAAVIQQSTFGFKGGFVMT